MNREQQDNEWIQSLGGQRPVRRKSGFTLIELLVVVAIMGVLFTIASLVFDSIGAKDTDQAAQELIGTFRMARMNAINKRQWTLVIFPTKDSTAIKDKQLRAYATLAVTNQMTGDYQFGSKQRDPKSSDMEFEFITDWKYLPEGIYFDDDTELTGNYVFGRGDYYKGQFNFPTDVTKPDNLVTPMGAILFKPNGRAYVMADGNPNGKYWQDTDYNRIYLTSEHYYEKTADGSLGTPTIIPGTNTTVMIRNKSGQVHIWDGMS